MDWWRIHWQPADPACGTNHHGVTLCWTAGCVSDPQGAVQNSTQLGQHEHNGENRSIWLVCKEKPGFPDYSPPSAFYHNWAACTANSAKDMCQATKLSHSVNFLLVHVEHTTTTTQCSNLLVVFSFFSSFKFPESPKPKCCSYETVMFRYVEGAFRQNWPVSFTRSQFRY